MSDVTALTLEPPATEILEYVSAGDARIADGKLKTPTQVVEESALTDIGSFS